MRRNRTMRAGVLLLALTLITSCFVGGTFAKYTTSGSGSDSARVAKFGVTVTGIGTSFATEYTTDDTGVAGTIAKSVVSSEQGEKVVAPGTKGNMTASAITGTPEVAVRVAYEATTIDFGDNWTDGTGYYCPIIIEVGDTTLDGKAYQNIDEFETAVKNEIASHTQNYAAGTDFAAETVAGLSVSWEWPFSTSAENDVKDTWLGKQAADGTPATIDLTVKTTVTQID